MSCHSSCTEILPAIYEFTVEQLAKFRPDMSPLNRLIGGGLLPRCPAPGIGCLSLQIRREHDVVTGIGHSEPIKEGGVGVETSPRGSVHSQAIKLEVRQSTKPNSISACRKRLSCGPGWESRRQWLGVVRATGTSVQYHPLLYYRPTSGWPVIRELAQFETVHQLICDNFSQYRRYIAWEREI
jgi:hypothetical protein